MTWSITVPADGARYSRTPPASLETRAMRSVGPRRNSTLQMNSSMMAGPHRAERPTKALYIGFPAGPFSNGLGFRVEAGADPRAGRGHPASRGRTVISTSS